MRQVRSAHWSQSVRVTPRSNVSGAASHERTRSRFLLPAPKGGVSQIGCVYVLPLADFQSSSLGSTAVVPAVARKAGNARARLTLFEEGIAAARGSLIQDATAEGERYREVVDTQTNPVVSMAYGLR